MRHENRSADAPEKPAAVLVGAEVPPETHGTIIFWSLIASLTRFIPLPLVDDLLGSGLEKMMFKQIAQAHTVPLSDRDLDVLSYDTTDFSGLKVAMRSSARLAGRLFLKTLLIFELKDAADTFSAVYHRGYLLDYSLQTKKLEQCTPTQLRVAIDRVCKNAGTSPVNRIFIGIMKESVSLLGTIKDFIIKSVSHKADKARAPERIAEKAPPETREIVSKLEKELDLMPPEYFAALRQNMDRAIEKAVGANQRRAPEVPDI